MTRRAGGRHRARVQGDVLGGEGSEDLLASIGLPDTEEQALHRDAVAQILGDADEARGDLVAFFEFVMRKEHGVRVEDGDGATSGPTPEVSSAATGERLRAAAHQRLIFEFIQAHPMCVIRMPPDTSKTFCMATAGLWYLGRDVTSRGAFISATQGQAMKPLGMVRDYVECSMALRLVFPGLAKSPRRQDPWTTSEITVARPPGIRDASAVATGLDGAIDGSRLQWAVVDDILNRENTSTKAGRLKVHDWFDSSVLTRLDQSAGRCVVTNVSWHLDDLTHMLEKAGWPCLTIDVEGGILITNADDWDSNEIRPAHRRDGPWCRLVAHDPDPAEEVPLWPERIDRAAIDKKRATHLPHRFAQLYMQSVRNDDAAACQIEWIERCKRPDLTLVSRYDGPNLVFCGVDLGVGLEARNAPSVFFTIELIPSNLHRRVLDVDIGHWNVNQLKTRFLEKHERYHPIFRVENNAAQQYLVDLVKDSGKAIPVKAHTTGRNKVHPEFGVESIFLELHNGYWEIPADRSGRVHRSVQHWVDDCLYYSPETHTGDALMACWFAREQAREFAFAARSRAGGTGQARLNLGGGHHFVR